MKSRRHSLFVGIFRATVAFVEVRAILGEGHLALITEFVLLCAVQSCTEGLPQEATIEDSVSVVSIFISPGILRRLHFGPYDDGEKVVGACEVSVLRLLAMVWFCGNRRMRSRCQCSVRSGASENDIFISFVTGARNWCGVRQAFISSACPFAS